MRKAIRDLLIDLPYREIRLAIDVVRKLSPVEWPEDDPHYRVPAPPADVEAFLRNRRHFEGVDLSYHYEGQELDLRRPEGADESGVQLAVHLRGRGAGGDGSDKETELIGHIEASRYEHQDDHMKETQFRTLDGWEIEYILTGGGLLPSDAPGLPLDDRTIDEPPHESDPERDR